MEASTFQRSCHRICAEYLVSEADMTDGNDLVRHRRVQYETAGLDVSDVDDSPVVQWHSWHSDAIEAGLVEPNAMTVATVDATSTPDARIVLAREVSDGGVTFFTNFNSTKSQQ